MKHNKQLETLLKVARVAQSKTVLRCASGQWPVDYTELSNCS
jgi:hypothetical protein